MIGVTCLCPRQDGLTRVCVVPVCFVSPSPYFPVPLLSAPPPLLLSYAFHARPLSIPLLHCLDLISTLRLASTTPGLHLLQPAKFALGF